MNHFTSRLQPLLSRISLSVKWDHKILQFFGCRPSAANLTTVFNSSLLFQHSCFPSSVFPSFTISCVKGGTLCLFWQRSKWNTTGRRGAAYLAQTSSFSSFSALFYTSTCLSSYCCTFAADLWVSSRTAKSVEITRACMNYCRRPVNLFQSFVFRVMLATSGHVDSSKSRQSLCCWRSYCSHVGV